MEIYVVYQNSDMTEGRGSMYPLRSFTTYAAALEYVGRPESGMIEIRPMRVFETAAEAKEQASKEYRERQQRIAEEEARYKAVQAKRAAEAADRARLEAEVKREVEARWARR
jgi:hypothetical protein